MAKQSDIQPEDIAEKWLRQNDPFYGRTRREWHVSRFDAARLPKYRHSIFLGLVPLVIGSGCYRRITQNSERTAEFSVHNIPDRG